MGRIGPTLRPVIVPGKRQSLTESRHLRFFSWRLSWRSVFMPLTEMYVGGAFAECVPTASEGGDVEIPGA